MDFKQDNLNERLMIQGILTIDCWEDSRLDKFYQQLDKHIDFSEIQSIVVANYETALDSSDVSLYNTLETYSWHTFCPTMLLPILREARRRKPSKWLQSKVDSHSFLLLDMASLTKHLEECVPHITNWLIIGGSWKQCTHGRPINVYALQSLPKNFYIADWSIYNQNNPDWLATRRDIENDDINWQPHNNYYLLEKHDSTR